MKIEEDGHNPSSIDYGIFEVNIAILVAFSSFVSSD